MVGTQFRAHVWFKALWVIHLPEFDEMLSIPAYLDAEKNRIKYAIRENGSQEYHVFRFFAPVYTEMIKGK